MVPEHRGLPAPPMEPINVPRARPEKNLPLRVSATAAPVVNTKSKVRTLVPLASTALLVSILQQYLLAAPCVPLVCTKHQMNLRVQFVCTAPKDIHSPIRILLVLVALKASTKQKTLQFQWGVRIGRRV